MNEDDLEFWALWHNYRRRDGYTTALLRASRVKQLLERMTPVQFEAYTRGCMYQ
jgi:hypothetical protein